MPIYEYKCEDCEKVSEVLVKNRANESSVVCPECQSANLSKLISAPGALITKGGSVDMPPMPACPNSGGCNTPSCPAFNN
jgi:putative FmdB family regulatory protein